MDQFSHDPEAFASTDDQGAQRGKARDSLLLSAQLRLQTMVAPVTVRVRNLSSGGLMAEHAGRASVGDVATVEVRGVGLVPGKVAWVAEGRIGIAFDHEIDPMLARKPVSAAPRTPAAPRRGRAIV